MLQTVNIDDVEQRRREARTVPQAAQFSSASVRTVALLDTAAGSTNLGDYIIMDAVQRELADLFADCMVFTIASHERMSSRSRRLIRQSRWAISGGTSLLSSRMWFRSNWNVTPLDALARLNVILMGAGWYQYQRAPDPYSRWLLKSLLSRDGIHSVRDGYTLRMLASIGVTNVVNTGCPTLWHLTAAHCGQLPSRKAGAVVATVNSYAGLKNPAADRRLLEILSRHYSQVYLWIQTDTDHEYARALHDKLIYIRPNVAALDTVLASDLDLDYVGNRLHAGIRALQHGRRAIIVEIDNRAREMGSDFGLPTVGRTEFERLERMIAEPQGICVTPPRAEIDLWKNQFRDG
jgi:polysaccharide pyruvyl transferase WcaK-like protein